MAYSEKYIMSFVSERGNEYRIVILQQNYTGEAVQKKLGVAPVLSVESGDGRIQGSSLAFSIQSDTEGELRGLYTTNNKEFKALLYRNGVLYWQGYLLPELYSENYIHPPYDVAVTATDQLATLKDVAYAGEDAQTSLLDIIKNILSYTQINLQCKVHMNLNDSNGISVLRGSYISAATYNGQSCYDALNAILLSCNCTIMQMGNQWLITSFTDYSYSYDLEGSEVLEAHATIGQMHQGDVWPSGSLNMVNAPALKGAKVDYNHTLRNSFLKNADITSREDWMYTPDPKDNELIPGIVEAIDGKKYKCFFWQLFQHNIAEDNSLRLWQDVRLSQDPGQVYSISLKYLFSVAADLLLLSVTYYGDNGQTYRLTGEGWTTNFSNSNLSSYIQITGKQQNVPYIWDVADMSKYETATVQFELPTTSGSIRIGFINSTADYAEPTNRPSSINVTQVYFTVSSVTGQTATTEVEKMATSAQEELELGYGDKASTINGDQLVLNTLRDAEGAAKSVWNLSGREFSSYYMAMLQEYSRYYGSKKMQLQGVVMGKDALKAFYIDTFSGLVMRLLSGQYNLLEDEVNISLEEVVTSFVYYDTVVYATDNKPQQNTSSSAGAVVSGGGATTLGGLINVDDNVDEVDTEVQVMIKDVDSKVWGKRPLSEVNFNEQKTSEYLVTNDYLTRAAAGRLYAPASVLDYFTDGSANDARMLGGQLPEYYATNSALTAVSNRVVELEKLFYYDAEHDAVRTSLSLIVDQWLTFGGAAMGSGSVTGSTTLAGLNDVQITEPTDGQSLVYDAAQGLWVNKAVSGGSGTEPLFPRTATKLYASSNVDDYYAGYYGWSDAINPTNFFGVNTGMLAIPSQRGLETLQVVFDANGSNVAQHPHIGVRTNFSKGTFTPWSVLLHSLNYSSYALPLSGGTITNNSTHNPLTISTNALHPAGYGSTELAFFWNGYQRAAAGFTETHGGFIATPDIDGLSPWYYLGIKPDGTPYYCVSETFYPLLHSGNYSSYALPLSGGTMAANSSIYLNGSSSNRLTGLILDSSFQEFVHANSYGYISFGPFNNQFAHIYTDKNSFYFNKNILIDGYSVITTTNIGSQSVNYANSAGKLATVRTIFGQPFDGTSNVDGVITTMQVTNSSVPVIKFSNGEHLDNWGNFCFGENSNTWSIRNSTSLTAQIYLQVVRATGNVLIGITKDLGYHFQVAGSGYFGGNVSVVGGNINFESNIAAMGATGISFWNNGWKTGHIEAGTLNLNTLYKGQTNIGGGLSVKGGVDYCFTVGVDSDNRSHLELVTQSNNPCDLALGADYDAYWSITARNVADTLSRALAFYSYKAGVYRMAILENGNVLIGTTTDFGSKLYVKSTTTSQGSIAAFDSSHSNYGYNYTNMEILFNGAVKGSWGWNNIPYSLGTQYDAGVFLLNDISGSGINIYDTGEILARTSFMRTLGNFEADGNISAGYAVLANQFYIEASGSSGGANNSAYARIGGYDHGGGLVIQFGTQSKGIDVIDNSWSKSLFSISQSGNLIAAGSVTFNLASDRRLKSNIKPLTYRNTIRVLHRLRPVSFEWNETAVSLDSTRQGLCDGFIADEYEGLIPNSGRDIWEKYRAIDYTRAIPYLAKGWQIHESELDKMRRKVKTMERRIEHLENLLVEHNIIAA